MRELNPLQYESSKVPRNGGVRPDQAGGAQIGPQLLRQRTLEVISRLPYLLARAHSWNHRQYLRMSQGKLQSRCRQRYFVRVTN
jgi:hypothetical protein